MRPESTAPSPASADAGSSYWQRQSGFALPRCTECERYHFYPRPACPWCGSAQVAPAPASGRGTVYSYSVVHRAPSPAFSDQVPYVIVIVATDEGPHLLSRIIDMAPEEVRIGLRVQVSFRPGEALGLPLFQPETQSI